MKTSVFKIEIVIHKDRNSEATKTLALYTRESMAVNTFVYLQQKFPDRKFYCFEESTWPFINQSEYKVEELVKEIINEQV